MAAVSQQNGGLHLCSGSNNNSDDFSSTEGSPAPAAVELHHRSSSSSPSSAPAMGLVELQQRHRRSSSTLVLTGTSLVGASCGQHGPYTFYKAAKVILTNRAVRILALGDFFLVKLWTDQEIIAIGELQLIWTDCYQSPDSPLASLKLYFMPENTPDGRHEEHGEDEVVSISEKVVLKVSDLATWIVEDVKWERGATSVWERHCVTPPITPPPVALLETYPVTDQTSTDPVDSPCTYGVLDMRDVIKEKSVVGDNVGGWNVLVLSYPAYCRYRSTLKRLEGHCQTDFMRRAVVEAIGGRAAPSPNTRVVFCKDTFDYPELEDHELLCNHLAPKWKGRPRKTRKKRSYSPGSESNESESSVSTVTSSSRSKDSPLKQPRGGIRNVPAPYRAGDRPKGEQLFLQNLHKFMTGRGTPIGRLPSLGFKQLDLFLFYNKVQRAGGYESAVANKQWKGIYIELGGHPSNTSAATCTRRHYEKLLLPFERQSQSEPVMATTPSSADSLPVAVAVAASVSSGTPPKKRKMSDHVQPDNVAITKDEPPKVQEEEEEEEDEEEERNSVERVDEATEESSNNGCGRIVESQLRLSPTESWIATPTDVLESLTTTTSPRIVESTLPLSSGGVGSVIVWSQSVNSIETTEAPQVIHRTDLTLRPPDPIEDQKRSLSLPDLVADPALLAAMAASSGADPKALNDLARLAQQHMDQAASNKISNNNLTRIKESKINPQLSDSSERCGSGQNNVRRPSIIINKSSSCYSESDNKKAAPKGSASGRTRNNSQTEAPPPAHSQKPVTLPACVVGGDSSSAGCGGGTELNQLLYSQMLSGTKETCIPAAGGRQQQQQQQKPKQQHQHSQVPPAAMLELALCPPTPAVVTPSIFVPSRRIYVDPALDVLKKSRPVSTCVGGSIPAAHSNRGMNPVSSNPNHPSNSGSSPCKAPPPVAASAAAASSSAERIPHLVQVNPPRSAPPPPIPPATHPASAVRQHVAPVPLLPPSLLPTNHHNQHHPNPNHNHLQQTGNIRQASSIPLVDLTSRSVKTEEPASSVSSNRTPTGHSKSLELNGKCHQLMDLSVSHYPHSFRPLSDQQQQQHKLPKSASWSQPQHHHHHNNHNNNNNNHNHSSRNSDVSISLNVKIEGSNSSSSNAEVSPHHHHHHQQHQHQQHQHQQHQHQHHHNHHHHHNQSQSHNQKTSSSGSSSHHSSHSHPHQQQQQRHSVSVVPVIKDEIVSSSSSSASARQQHHHHQHHNHRREKELMLRPTSSSAILSAATCSSSSSIIPPQTSPQVQSSYPRMVDSLAMSKAVSSGGGGGAPPPPLSYNYATTPSVSSSSSSAVSVAAAAAGGKAPTSSISGVGYPALMDPALASYYSSIYSPHMYGLPPPGAFAHLPGAHGHHPAPNAGSHQHHPGAAHHHGLFHHVPHTSSAAAEVTAQVYKDLVQRGYPPALAPGLPPGLAGIPGLGSYAAAMFSSLGAGGGGGGSGAPGSGNGKESNNPSERSQK